MATSEELEAILKKIPDLDPDVRAICKEEGLPEKPSNEEVLKAVVKQRPDLAALHIRPDKGKLTGPAWPAAQEVFDAVLKGGKDTLTGLMDLLKEVDNGADWKARYVLHGVATCVGLPDKKDQRTLVMDTFAAQLGGPRPKVVQLFLLRELLTVGDKRVAPAVAKCLPDEELGMDAARVLLGFGDVAAEHFRAALPGAKGRLKTMFVQGLGLLKDAGSLAAIKEAAGDADADTRTAAVWAMANMGDASCVAIAAKASGIEGWEGIQAVKACLLLAEKLLAAGNKAEAAKLYKHLQDTRKDKADAHIREAAARGLAAAG